LIDALIRDCASDDREDSRFPWMRSFDPYAGHSWAAGHAGFGSGNNQESSSESMNFATSLILYGQATGRDDIRDLGIYWHSTEAEAVRQYWFDQDRAVFPDGYAHSCVGMVWGDGASYGTWWTANPEEIHGINFLPVNGGSLYLGRDPGYVRANLDDLRASNKNFHEAGFDGDPLSYDRWQDILAEYLALADPDAATK
jgi:endoglucanase Acf2